MADLRPIITVMKPEQAIEGDCACPDASFPAPEVRWVMPSFESLSDCACPDALPVAAWHAPHRGNRWQRTPGLHRMPLSDDHEIVYGSVSLALPAVLNQPASHLLDAFCTPRTLHDVAIKLPMLDEDGIVAAFREMVRLGLIQDTRNTLSTPSAQPTTLTAWLHVTQRCNLHCAYCYAKSGHQEMDETTAATAVNALFQSAARHGLHTVKLKYAGGEPTLNLPIVLSIHERARLLADRYGLALREIILSNGFDLPNSALETLRAAGIGLAISLDGIGPANDVQRGAGSAERAIGSLDRAIALGIRPHVSITITSLNVHALRDVVGLVLARVLPFNLNFYRNHDKHAASWLQPESDQLIDGLRSALALVEQQLPRQSVVAGLLDRCYVGAPHHHACGLGQSYVAISPRGNIARCHMELDTGPIVGHVRHDDLITAIRSSTGHWHFLHVDGRHDCRHCDWRYWCAGGCPLLARRSGRDDAPSPYCHVYKALLPDLLRLHGLWMLKWGTVSS